VPDTSEKQKRKAKKLKQQIQWELRSKAKNSEEARGSNCAPGLTEWLLPLSFWLVWRNILTVASITARPARCRIAIQ